MLRERHGMSYTPLYQSYREMKRRCLTPTNKDYKYYGGRGITVCDRWENSYLAYFEDVGDKPFPEASVDRLDNDGHYSCGKCAECLENNWPKNFRWATKTEQNYNRRMLPTGTGQKGVGKVGDKYSVNIYLGQQRKYLGLYKTLKEAVYIYFLASVIRSQNYLEREQP